MVTFFNKKKEIVYKFTYNWKFYTYIIKHKLYLIIIQKYWNKTFTILPNHYVLFDKKFWNDK